MKNSITIEGNKIILFLEEKNFKKRRTIGILLGNKIVTQKHSVNHFFRAHKSFGFNREMIENIEFDILEVVLEDSTKLYTTKIFILEKGIPDTTEDDERQLHLPLNKFGLKIAREFENAHKHKIVSYTIWDFLKDEGGNI